MFDSFWRAETPATAYTVMRSVPIRNVIGDLRARDADGNITTGLRMLPGRVLWVYRKPGRVIITPAVRDGMDIITPAVTDPWCWIQLRLLDDAEVADDDTATPDDDEGEPAPRFDRSRIRKWMQDNGDFAYLDQDPAWSGIPGSHVRGFMYTLGNGKRIAILNGSEIQAAGPPVHFHDYCGGNFTK